MIYSDLYDTDIKTCSKSGLFLPIYNNGDQVDQTGRKKSEFNLQYTEYGHFGLYDIVSYYNSTYVILKNSQDNIRVVKASNFIEQIQGSPLKLNQTVGELKFYKQGRSIIARFVL